MPVEHVPIEHVPVEPVPVEHVPIEPVLVEPVPVEPVSLNFVPLQFKELLAVKCQKVFYLMKLSLFIGPYFFTSFFTDTSSFFCGQ